MCMYTYICIIIYTYTYVNDNDNNDNNNNNTLSTLISERATLISEEQPLNATHLASYA